MKKCCEQAVKDLEKAREWAGMMAVHEAYAPEKFNNALMKCEMIEMHLKYCALGIEK